MSTTAYSFIYQHTSSVVLQKTPLPSLFCQPTYECMTQLVITMSVLKSWPVYAPLFYFPPALPLLCYLCSEASLTRMKDSWSTFHGLCINLFIILLHYTHNVQLCVLCLWHSHGGMYSAHYHNKQIKSGTI